MTKALVVVAKQEGFYGNQLYPRGARFAIASEEAFSKVWMIDVETKDRRELEELRTLETEYASRASAKRRTISDEQLLAEMAMADGTAMAAIRAENAKLKAKVAELTKQMEALNEASIAAAEEADEGPETAGEGEPESAGGEPDAGPEPATRRTRRIAKE